MVFRSFRPFFIFMLLFVAFATANARQMKAKSDLRRKNMAVSSANVASVSLQKIKTLVKIDATLAPLPVVLKLPGVPSKKNSQAHTHPPKEVSMDLTIHTCDGRCKRLVTSP